MMKKLTYAVLLTALGLIACPSQSRAQTDLNWTREVEVTARSVPNWNQSAKFNEYRDIHNGVYINLINLGYARQAKYFDFTATNVGLDDQRYVLSGGLWGRFKADVFYDSLPHNFAYGALSMYNPATLGTGDLTLIGARTNAAGAAAWFPNNSAPVDIGLTRKTTGGDFSYNATDSIKLNFGITNEQREGDRPLFGTFGVSGTGTMELAEPIDYSTTTYKAGVDYAHTNTFVSMSYSKSDFSNNIDSLTWDNPFQATNGAATLNSAGTSLSSAPARGQMALSPDNEAHNWALTGAVTKLPWNSTLSASFTRGEMTQNDSMLPMTFNSNILNSNLLSPAQRLALNSTPGSANLKVDTSLDTVTWSARPIDRLSLKARYRRYHYDNKSPYYLFPYSVVTDGSTSTVASDLETEPRSYKTTLGSLDANYELGRGTNLLVGYRSEKIDRVNCQVPESTEDGPSIAIERTVGGWLSLKSSYEHLDRTGDQKENEFLDNLLYFNQAPRKTTRRRFEAIASVNDRLTLSANAGLTKFNYPDSAYGRLNYNMNDYALQADYELKNGANTYAYYSHETFQVDQRNYTVPRTAGGVSGNWSAVNDDMVQTVGLGISGKSEKYRLTYGANLAQSWTKGSLGFLSEVSTNLNPVPWTSVDASSLKQINLGVRYNIQHNLDWSTGIMWERFRMNDFDNNAPNVPTNASGAYNGAILMGTLPSYYNVRTLYTSVSLKF